MDRIAACQSFSSTSKSNKPSVVDGYEGLMQYATRCRDRIDLMDRYRAEGVFPPGNFSVSNYILFNKLQLPTHTEVDAIDFLDGAKFACDLTMNTMYSREFVNFATGAITESPAAEKLRAGLSPACFDAFVFAMQETTKAGTLFLLKELEFRGVFLSDVYWDRMSLADLKGEQALAELARAELARFDAEQEGREGREELGIDDSKRVENAAAQDEEKLLAKVSPEDHGVMVERLRIDVQFNIKEVLDVTTPDSPVQSIERESSPVWRFESMVTQPEDVDWRIVSVV